MKKKPKKKVARPSRRKMTLTDVVKVAHKLGMEVSVKLVPNEAPPTFTTVSTGSITSTTQINVTPRQPHNWPTSQWPGDPTNRHIIAAMDYGRRDVERGFRDNPTAKWIITPYEIIPRETFFNPPPATVLPAVGEPQPTDQS